MEWIKKHVDTVIVLGGILGSMLWMNGKFNEIEKDIAIIKTMLVMKNIMPSELCKDIDVSERISKPSTPL